MSDKFEPNGYYFGFGDGVMIKALSTKTLKDGTRVLLYAATSAVDYRNKTCVFSDYNIFSSEIQTHQDRSEFIDECCYIWAIKKIDEKKWSFGDDNVTISAFNT